MHETPQDGPQTPESEVDADAVAPDPTEDAEDEKQSPEQLAEAKEYNRLTFKLTLVDMALDLVVLIVSALVIAKPLDDWLQQTLVPGDSIWMLLLRVSLFSLILLAFHEVVSFGLTYYRGYVVEHRYDLSNQTPARWLTQRAKMLALLCVMTPLMTGALYGIIWMAGAWWW